MSVLEGELTISRAAELKPGLLALLEEPGDVELDLSQVTELDSAGLQLLLLVAREALLVQKALRLRGHSAAVQSVLDLLQLGPDLAPLAAAPGQGSGDAR